MSRLEIASPKRAKIVMEGLYKDLERRIESSPPGLCPVDMARAFLELCHAQVWEMCAVSDWTGTAESFYQRRTGRKGDDGNVGCDGADGSFHYGVCRLCDRV